MTEEDEWLEYDVLTAQRTWQAVSVDLTGNATVVDERDYRCVHSCSLVAVTTGQALGAITCWSRLVPAFSGVRD